ncbi:leucyl/phenylalanyl-tRNA--protein transferase [Aestuariimicrobium ganziense]|uniref:leucyl/phenylalanyl-tRNA--protein transferase n=1 Tax=Aestuariimicrobium ganziense TaxID=2773677 RepID=UPI001944DCF6|nr:leucyl/phenylalanyl-tRNA--protein transferase [Aestuariimicrobium ganziense]
MLAHVFGYEREWPDQDLIGFSKEFDAPLTLAAYRSGVFPMPLASAPGDMGWWSPKQRGVLPLTALKVSRSLRRSATRYTTSVDQAFAAVVRRCADPAREGGWIDRDVVEVFTQLHAAGFVHSVEVWDDQDVLVGGLYGVSVGGLFAGESMFHDPERGRDASKVALVRLIEELAAGVPRHRLGLDRLLDVQWVTEHLASLGAVEVSRTRYLERLDRVLDAPGPRWPSPAQSRRAVELSALPAQLEGEHTTRGEHVA